jgi:3-dehydroquinate synthetase
MGTKLLNTRELSKSTAKVLRDLPKTGPRLITRGNEAVGILFPPSPGGIEADIDLLRRFDLPVQLPSNFATEELLRIARMDKKFEHGKIRFILLSALGSAHVSNVVTEDHLREVLAEIRGA